jgi:hypothetical protein
MVRDEEYCSSFLDAIYLHASKIHHSQAQWPMSVILDMWEAEIGGSQFEASPGKKLARSYLKE